VKLQLFQLSIFLILWLWDFLFVEIYLDKDALSSLYIGYSVSLGIILSRKDYVAW
jgi:hypothetical protein